MEEKKQILFVDDDPNVLRGLQRMLRSKRTEWQMTFVESGAEALAWMEKNSLDVIVSDMRMPSMDGAALLSRVRENYPSATRIVLSGHSDKEMIIRAVGSAHQYLTKPCDPEALKGVVSRALALREILEDDKLQEIISGLSSLPSPPELYLEFISELQAEEPSLERIIGIISRDLSMTAKVLQLVNSSFFGLRRNISSAEEAARLLGLETIRSVVLSIDAFRDFELERVAEFDTDELWAHSVSVGVYAHQIAAAEQLERRAVQEAFSAGMLHDIGQIVLATNFAETYAEVRREAKETGVPAWQLEVKTFGASHAEIGAYLLGIWGLPDPVVEAVAYHHNPQACVSREFLPLSCVHAANVIEQAFSDGLSSADKRKEIDEQYLKEVSRSKNFHNWELLCRVTAEEGLKEEMLRHRQSEL